jgi:hypothetical protein
MPKSEILTTPSLSTKMFSDLMSFIVSTSKLDFATHSMPHATIVQVDKSLCELLGERFDHVVFEDTERSVQSADCATFDVFQEPETVSFTHNNSTLTSRSTPVIRRNLAELAVDHVELEHTKVSHDIDMVDVLQDEHLFLQSLDHALLFGVGLPCSRLGNLFDGNHLGIGYVEGDVDRSEGSTADELSS